MCENQRTNSHEVTLKNCAFILIQLFAQVSQCLIRLAPVLAEVDVEVPFGRKLLVGTANGSRELATHELGREMERSSA